MRTGLSYNDVCLVPKYNNIISRSEPDLGSWLSKDYHMMIPIVAANMDSVIGPKLAEVMHNFGSPPIFHRFYKDTTELIDLVDKYRGRCFMSWGVKGIDHLKSMVEDNDLRPIGICVDIAHGHSLTVCHTIEKIREWKGDYEIIAGNVCTAQAYHDLCNAGATAVKVGIGPGSVCTTRDVTGFGVPQLTALQDCAKVALSMKIPMIADGGIKSSREIVLALAAGASSVMVGGLLAATKEAAGQGVYRGQASHSFQESFYGGVKEGTVPEGTVIGCNVLSSAKMVLDNLLGGIRSGMTYGGAINIKELQRKAEFMRVTEDYR
jgi:IMP dehydrogenase